MAEGAYRHFISGAGHDIIESNIYCYINFVFVLTVEALGLINYTEVIVQMDKIKIIIYIKI